MKTDKEHQIKLGLAMVKACDKLSAYAEQLGLTVAGIRIIASVDTHDGASNTALATAGTGNWHAQRGAIRDWIDAKDSYEAGFHGTQGGMDFDAIESGREEPDEGEEWKGTGQS